jgi:hypothetical protein
MTPSRAWDAKFNHAYSSHELMADIRAELDGNYILKPKYTPAGTRPQTYLKFSAGEPSANILPRGRVRLTRQFDPHLSPAAQRFLDGN